jgi:hypothetical protein
MIRCMDQRASQNQQAAPLAANLGLARPPAIYLTAIVAGLVLHFAWPIPFVPSFGEAARRADRGSCRHAVHRVDQNGGLMYSPLLSLGTVLLHPCTGKLPLADDSPAIKPSVGKRLLQGAALVVALLSISAWAIYQITPSLLAHQFGFRRSEFAVRAQRGTTLLTSDGIPL